MSLTSTQKKDNNIVELEISVEPKALQEAADRVFRRKGKTITVPGFRKGKAPRKLIEKIYGEGIFLEEALNDLYPAVYGEAVEEAGVDPVDQAQVEILTLDKEKGCAFKATVTVKPEVSISDYKGLEAEKRAVEVTEADVEEEIKHLRERNSRIITVEGRAAESGDTAVIDFDGFVDDIAFEGGKGEDHELVLGSGSFIDNFEDQIVGHSVGDAFDVNVTFPEEYHSEELKGKPALFKVTLKELKSKELPEVDDEFAKDVSEFDTLDALKEDIRKQMLEHREKHAKEDFENLLASQIAEKLVADIPECMFESRTDELIREFEQRLTSQGLNLDMYLQYAGTDMESFRANFQEQAQKQVKIRLALEKIADLEGIEATPEEIDAEYAKMAENFQVEVDKIKPLLSEKDVVKDIRCNKALDFVQDNAVEKTENADKPESTAKAAGEKSQKAEGETKAGEAAKKPVRKPRAKKTEEKTEE